MGWSSATKASTPKTGRAKVLANDAGWEFSPVIAQHKVDWKHLVTLDMETFWDVDYTLSKMSTSEYVRDPRFRAHMVGIKIGTGKTRVIPHEKISAELRKIDWKTHDLLCHNTAFDGFILSHHEGIVPRIYYDTLSMARGLFSNDIGASLGEVGEYLGLGGKIEDVLIDSKGVHTLPAPLYKRMAVYCGRDVDLCLDIFKKMLVMTPESEIKLIHLTVKMFADPVLKVNIPRVEKELARELAAREALLMSIDVSGYDDKKLKLAERSLPEHEKRLLKAKKIVGSSEQFSALITALGVEVPVKLSPAWMKLDKANRELRIDDKWAPAFAKDDADFIELPARILGEGLPGYNRNKAKDIEKLARIAERMQQLIDVRLAVKSTTNITRAQRFLTAGANGMPLPVGYAYARAHTLRWGGNNKMNMQNLKRGGELRLAIEAPAGHVLSVVDSGQIECRVNGWLWDQDDLMDDFRNADSDPEAKVYRDAYCNFGDLIYGKTVTKADKMERFVGKVAVLGLGFQMGAEKFQGTLAKGALGGPPVFFPLDKCKAIVNAYRRKNYRIAEGWKRCTLIIEDMAAGRTGSWKCLNWEEGRIWGPDGTCLKYPNLKKAYNADKGWDEWTYEAKGKTKKIYGGLLCENIVQWLARMVVATQMLEIAEKYRVVMITHDEIVALARKRSADVCYRDMMKAMRRSPAWCSTIPLNAEGGHAVNYSK